jgi:hypothetical protein
MKRYNIVTRCLALVALFFVYVVGTSAILVGATTSSAQAWVARGGGRGWGGGRGFYRGGGRGYGRGYGYYGGPAVVVRPGPRCWWNGYARVCRW